MKRLVELSDEEVSAYTIPEGVTGIEDGAFRWCDDLEVITLAGSVTDVGRGAFTDTGELRAIAVAEGNSVYAAQDGILFTKDMKTLVCYPPAKDDSAYTISAGVTSIGKGAFERCGKLTGLIIPDGVTGIGKDAFNAERLRSITVTEGNAVYVSRDGVQVRDCRFSGIVESVLWPRAPCAAGA
jgi:hypothetical protein